MLGQRTRNRNRISESLQTHARNRPPNTTAPPPQLVPELPYVDSSPSNGVVSRQPYIKRWGATWDARYGDGGLQALGPCRLRPRSG
jgi:hypothetical protein